MKKLGKLKLSKEVITSLDKEELGNLKGGECTDGCTDGCGGRWSLATFFNCTCANCTHDCTVGYHCEGYC